MNKNIWPDFYMDFGAIWKAYAAVNMCLKVNHVLLSIFMGAMGIGYFLVAIANKNPLCIRWTVILMPAVAISRFGFFSSQDHEFYFWFLIAWLLLGFCWWKNRKGELLIQEVVRCIVLFLFAIFLGNYGFVNIQIFRILKHGLTEFLRIIKGNALEGSNHECSYLYSVIRGIVIFGRIHWANVTNACEFLC